jgi:eukaryotic-like serine/threonine-protein kinase
MADTLARLQSALADRYSIEWELGARSMVTASLAEDLKHRRKVALKGIAVPRGADRSTSEIEVAARLEHPNILPLLDCAEPATGGRSGE